MWFSYYKTTNRTAPCGVVRCDALLLTMRCGYAILRLFWCGFYSLCGLVNTFNCGRTITIYKTPQVG